MTSTDAQKLNAIITITDNKTLRGLRVTDKFADTLTVIQGHHRFTCEHGNYVFRGNRAEVLKFLADLISE